MENKNTQILKSSIGQNVVLLILAILILIVEIKGFSSAHPRLTAWVAIVLCPFVILKMADRLLPGSSGLLIQPEGFRLKSFYRLRPLVEWKNIKGFEAVGWHSIFYHTKDVRYVFLESSKGVESKLPDNYGMKAEALADFLNIKRAEYLGIKS